MTSFKRFTCCVPYDYNIDTLKILGYNVYNITPERICLDKIIGEYTIHKSAGCIIFNRTFDKVLLVCNGGGYIWSFPKGTQEEMETLQQTAVREVFEETGIKITNRNFVKSVRYKTELNIDEKLVNKFRKKWEQRRNNTSSFRFEKVGMHIFDVTLFITIISENTHVSPQVGEISKVEWHDFVSASKLLGQNEVLQAFLDALDILKLPHPKFE